jgi:glycosyltransferase involved in cell wall biosynthesis
VKILLISPLPPPAGGIASWTKRYLETQQAQANNVRIINTAVIGSRKNQFNKMKIKDELIRTINIIKSLKSELTQNMPQIVHLNTPCSKLGLIRDYLCGKLVKKSGAKLLIHCRCDVAYMVKGIIAEMYYRRLVKLADEIVTLNASSRQYTLEKCGRDSTIIPNFLPDGVLEEINSRNERRTGFKNCLYVGHITKTKGCDLILEVAQLMPHITFTMVGFVSEEIKQLDKPDNLVFVGEVSKEQVVDCMNQADMFIFPTLSEGFPNVVMEAMACGLPIVATGVGAIPDMIEDKGGIIIEVGDINGFVTAIKHIQGNSELCDQMSTWNRTKVERRYTEQKVMDALFKKYSELLNDY